MKDIRLRSLDSVYGGVKQSRLVVFSENGMHEAVNTIQTHVTKEAICQEEACRAKTRCKKTENFGIWLCR